MFMTLIARELGRLARTLRGTTVPIATWSRWLALFLMVAVMTAGCKKM
jgi:hypothetical protein